MKQIIENLQSAVDKKANILINHYHLRDGSLSLRQEVAY